MPTVFEKSHPFLAFKLPVLLYAVLIFVMSAIPGDALPPLGFWSFDKLVHTVVFGLFGILLYRAFRFPVAVQRPYLWTAVIGFLYAASDEFHQRFVPGRYASVADFVFDCIGILVFALVSARLHMYPAVSEEK